MDILPTLCDICGITPPADIDGVSLLPLLSGKGVLKRDAIFSESVFLGSPEYAGCMIRQGKLKYNYYLDGTEELYDMEHDLQESENLASEGKYENIKQNLRRRLFNFWEPERQPERVKNTPKVKKQKHCYKYSNQFIIRDGIIFDARP